MVMNSEPSASLAPSQNERIMAAIAHISIFLPLTGLIAPIVIWFTQKTKSPYVTFHSLQAIGLQLTMILFWLLGMACNTCSFFSVLAMLGFALSNSKVSRTTLGLFQS